MNKQGLDQRVTNLFKRYGIDEVPFGIEVFEQYSVEILNGIITYHIKTTHDGSNKAKDIADELMGIYKDGGFHLAQEPKVVDDFYNTRTDLSFVANDEVHYVNEK